MSKQTTFEKLVGGLQHQLGTTPEIPQPSDGRHFLGYLIKKLHALKVKMYQEPGHALPHIHIDHGRNNHAASYSINPPARLEGNLDARSEQIVLTWLTANGEKLLSAWNALQNGAPNYELFAELKGGG